MHWILQAGPSADHGLHALMRALRKLGLPFSEHKILLPTRELQPDIDCPGKVIAFGNFAIVDVAERKRWVPGCFRIDQFSFRDCLAHWQEHMLNSDAIFATLGAVEPRLDPFFIRPSANKKYFPGSVMRLGELDAWRQKLLSEPKKHGAKVTESTEVLWCSAKQIEREYRLWIIAGGVATASSYGVGADDAGSEIEPDAIRFGEDMAALWMPAGAYVLDVCRSDNQWKIVEINLINAATLYAADACRLVMALENAFG